MSNSYLDDIRTIMERELTKLNKKEVVDIHTRLIHTILDPNNTKLTLIQNIITKLIRQLTQLQQTITSPQQIYQQFITYFDRHDLKLPHSRKICSHVLLRQGDFRQRTNQQTVANIWDESFKIECICQHSSRSYNKYATYQPCYRCGRMFHMECFWLKDSDELFQCPFCFLKHMNPKKEVKEVLFGGYLIRNNVQQ